MSSFGDKLRQLRHKADLSQQELIDLLKKKNPDITISKSMISKWENGKEEPSRFQDVAAIAETFGVTTDYLIGLTEKEYDKNINFKRVPVLGVIAAGRPILAQEYIEGYEYVPEHSGIDFCLRVKGTSMIGARIYDGDIVYIHQQSDVENGEIAAVIIDGEEATLKRVFKKGGSIVLHAENPTFPDMVFSFKDKKDIRIIGKAKMAKFEIK